MGDQDKTADLVINHYETSSGGNIFQIPVRVFPGLLASVYLVLVEDAEGGPYRVLIDAGSGLFDANQDLVTGLKAVSQQIDQQIGLADLTHIFITHGHIDHFGGLAYIRPLTEAKIGVHELDLRNLTNYEERLIFVARRLEEFFIESGVSPERRQKLLDMYKMTKSIYHSVRVDFTYEAIEMRLGPFELLHVPGHCPGQVVIRLDDVLFSGDHVLDRTSPHQSPEQLSLSTGLEHYLQSLEDLRSWAKDIRLTLGGHGKPIAELPARIDAIRDLHEQRLQQVLDLLAEPHSVSEVSHALFGDVFGYNVLLALEEAGAHVEYLYQHGLLEIENLADLENLRGPAPIRYRRL